MSEISAKDFRAKVTGITLEDFINNTRDGLVVLGVLEIGDDPNFRRKCIEKECKKYAGYRPDDIWYFEHSTINGLFVIVRRVKPGSKIEAGLKMCGFTTPYKED